MITGGTPILGNLHLQLDVAINRDNALRNPKVRHVQQNSSWLVELRSRYAGFLGESGTKVLRESPKFVTSLMVSKVTFGWR